MSPAMSPTLTGMPPLSPATLTWENLQRKQGMEGKGKETSFLP